MTRLDFFYPSEDVPKTNVEALERHAIHFEDFYPIRKLPEHDRRALVTQSPEGEAGVDEYIEEEKAEAIRIKEFVAGFFVEHVEDFKEFFDLSEFPSDIKVCFVPGVLHRYDKRRRKGDYNGRYDPKTRRAFVYSGQNSAVVGKDIDYVRVALHEYIHALGNESPRKSGFRGDLTGKHFSGIDETMTEYLVQKFFKKYHSKKNQPTFNTEYLEEAGFIDALSTLVGFEQVRNAYMREAAFPELLAKLTALNKKGVVFDFDLLEGIHGFFGGKCNARDMRKLLVGDPVAISKQRFNEFTYRPMEGFEDAFEESRKELLVLVGQLRNVTLVD